MRACFFVIFITQLLPPDLYEKVISNHLASDTSHHHHENCKSPMSGGASNQWSEHSMRRYPGPV